MGKDTKSRISDSFEENVSSALDYFSTSYNSSRAAGIGKDIRNSLYEILENPDKNIICKESGIYKTGGILDNLMGYCIEVEFPNPHYVAAQYLERNNYSKAKGHIYIYLGDEPDAPEQQEDSPTVHRLKFDLDRSHVTHTFKDKELINELGNNHCAVKFYNKMTEKAKTYRAAELLRFFTEFCPRNR